MRVDVLTLFPEIIEPALSASIIGRARGKGILDIRLLNIRDFSTDKHRRVDDYPFGGGAGMLLMADPVFAALESIEGDRRRVLYMSPRGRLLDQRMVETLSEEQELVLLCGHYEGIDQRIIDHFRIEEVSIGDYVLTGGELPAMVLIDAMARLLPDVLGSSESHNEESICSGLLEYPHYTKPRTYRGIDVPEVLVSGNHRLIHLWRYEKSLRLTKERRPDLFRKYAETAAGLTKEEKKILERVKEGPDESENQEKKI